LASTARHFHVGPPLPMIRIFTRRNYPTLHTFLAYIHVELVYYQIQKKPVTLDSKFEIMKTNHSTVCADYFSEFVVNMRNFKFKWNMSTSIFHLIQ